MSNSPYYTTPDKLFLYATSSNLPMSAVAPEDIEIDSGVPVSPPRSLSRSPRPYRRTQSPRSEPQPVGIRRWSMHETQAERWDGGGSGCEENRGGSVLLRSLPAPVPSASTPLPSRGPQPVLWAFRNQGTSFGSESGTEADDELPRKLPAPPRRTRSKAFTAGEDDYGEVTGGTTGDRDGGDDSRSDRGERSKRWFRGNERDGKSATVVGGRGADSASGDTKKRRKPIAFTRRVVEVALMVGIVVVTLTGKRRDGKEGRVWEVVMGEYRIGEYFIFEVRYLLYIGGAGFDDTAPQKLSRGCLQLAEFWRRTLLLLFYGGYSQHGMVQHCPSLYVCRPHH